MTDEMSEETGFAHYARRFFTEEERWWLDGSFLGRLPQSLRDQLWDRGRPIRLHDGQGSDNQVLIVLNGTVKVFHHGIGGGRLLVELAGRGDLVDPQAVLAPGAGTSYSVTDSWPPIVLRVARTRFEEFLTSNPVAMRSLTEVLSISANRLCARNACADRLLTDRVYGLLVEWSSRHRDWVWGAGTATWGPSDKLVLQLPQSDIGAALGVSTGSIERAMSTLREKGLISTGYRWIEIHQRKRGDA